MARVFIRSASALLVIAMFTAAASAQEGGRPPRGRFGGGFAQGGFNSGLAGTWLLNNEQVRKELEIVDDQIEKLQQIQREGAEQMREMWAGLRDLGEEERRERMASLREKSQEMQTNLQKKIDEVLLPHQRDRLKQINLQMQMRSGGGGNASAIAQALQLTDAQREELREKEQQIAAELRAKIEQAQKDARNELLQILTPEQRSKLEAMLGEPFELQVGGQGGFRGRGQRRDGSN